MKSEGYFRQLWEGKRSGIADFLLLSLLIPLSFPYALALRIRGAAYGADLIRSRRLPRPVVAVGNLTVGGTGKTPMVAHLSRWFLARGKRVTVLSRGYGGSLEGETRIVADGGNIFLSPCEAGDEPCLLASSVPGLAVVIGADRYRAGMLAMERLKPDIFILDDGFQHLRLRRDLNLLLLDCDKPFGNGRTLPAGMLREPPSAVERADLVIYTRCGGKAPGELSDKPWCAVSHRITGVTPVGGGDALSPGELANLRILAFAGIADPSSFFQSLGDAGISPAATLAFPDHCGYGEPEIAAICRQREACRCDCLITTGKDAVKLAACLERIGTVYAAELELEFVDPLPLELALGNLL